MLRGCYHFYPTEYVPMNTRIDFNTATAAEIDAAISGIGPKLAAKIVAHRGTSKRFQKPEDLRDVNGIGPARAALLEQHWG